MKKLIFATKNDGKLAEAIEILGIEVVGDPLEIDEIQSLDPVEVATKKAKAYYVELKKPLFIEDVSLVFDALIRLPGTYINDFSKALGNDGLCKLIGDGSRKAKAQTTIVHIDNDGNEHVFEGVVEGSIADSPRGDKGFGWDPIFIPDGDTRTFAEMDLDEKNNYSMRKIALTKFKKWLDNESETL